MKNLKDFILEKQSFLVNNHTNQRDNQSNKYLLCSVWNYELKKQFEKYDTVVMYFEGEPETLYIVPKKDYFSLNKRQGRFYECPQKFKYIDELKEYCNSNKYDYDELITYHPE